MDNKELANTLRKVAADLKAHKEKKAIETREKCAAVLVAKIGLNELINNLHKVRR